MVSKLLTSRGAGKDAGPKPYRIRLGQCDAGTLRYSIGAACSAVHTEAVRRDEARGQAVPDSVPGRPPHEPPFPGCALALELELGVQPVECAVDVIGFVFQVVEKSPLGFVVLAVLLDTLYEPLGL